MLKIILNYKLTRLNQNFESSFNIIFYSYFILISNGFIYIYFISLKFLKEKYGQIEKHLTIQYIC